MIREKPETRETVADLEARCARALEGFDFQVWETSILAPYTVSAAFSLSLSHVLSESEIVAVKLREICQAFHSPVAMLHDVGGFLFGRYVEPGAQIQEVIHFAEIVNDISAHIHVDAPSELMVIALSEVSEIALSVFPVRNDYCVFSLLLPRGVIARDQHVQAQFRAAVTDLAHLMQMW